MLEVYDGTTDASNYTYSDIEIQHANSESGTSDTLFREILEGYSESSTYDSWRDYDYREYIDNGQRLYLITETTNITFALNPTNTKIYTHANMTNDDYYIKVWLDDVDLSLAAPSEDYHDLGILNGVETLDIMEINVRGSIYDDIDS